MLIGTGRTTAADRLLLAYFAAGALALILRRDHVAGWPYFLFLHGACLALISALIAGRRRWPAAHAWYPLAMAILMFEEVALLNFMFVSDWQDRRLLGFEAALFVEPPTQWLGRFASPFVTELLAIGYFSYYLMLPAVGAVLYRRQETAAFEAFMAATVLAFLACYAVFVAFPTEGPRHSLRHLHTAPLTGGPVWSAVLLIQSSAGVHGNAFPSAHAAGAAVALVFAFRHARAMAVWLLPLVLLMCVGAVYLRYHYASDMAAGLLVGAIAAGCVRSPRRGATGAIA
jgi:membrane-associated phospholipid phosphatase